MKSAAPSRQAGNARRDPVSGARERALTEFVFTITEGRTGTGSLFELFKRHDSGALAFHEHLNVDSHGILTPDVGLMRRFNTYGLTREVAAFWKRKLSILREEMTKAGAHRYCETAHMNAKCGLVEFVLNETSEDRFRFIILNRAPEKIARSIYERRDMDRQESAWLWYLDPEYARRLVDPEPYLALGYAGKVAWYVREVEARKQLYKAMLNGRHDVLSIDIDQPDWAEIVAASYGLNYPGTSEPLVSNQNEPDEKRALIEQRFREILAQIPFSARAAF
jgi:hypothetical protein